MKFCIVGVGAIGGFVGAKLALAGEDVTFIARWKNLDAIRANGMTVTLQDGTFLHANTVKATDSFAAVGHVDCVSLEKRIDGAEKVGKHKTSMLQDVEAGRAIEIDALVGSWVR